MILLTRKFSLTLKRQLLLPQELHRIDGGRLVGFVPDVEGANDRNDDQGKRKRHWTNPYSKSKICQPLVHLGGADLFIS